MELTCPKCHGTMRTYERNGVHVEQCSDCRGIFLDRGELDLLVDAENAWHGRARGTGESHRERYRDDDDHDEYRREQEYRGEYRGHQDKGLGAVVGEVLGQVRGSGHGGSHYGSGYPRKKKKESFLGDIFG